MAEHGVKFFNAFSTSFGDPVPVFQDYHKRSKEFLQLVAETIHNLFFLIFYFCRKVDKAV